MSAQFPGGNNDPQPSTHAQAINEYRKNPNEAPCHNVTLRIIDLTIVVSAMDPKLLIKMLQVTLTGGPAERKTGIERSEFKKKRSSNNCRK